MLIQHSIETNMTKEQFFAKATMAFEFYKTRYASVNPTIGWDNSKPIANIKLSVLGMVISGKIAWKPGCLKVGSLQVEMDVPPLLGGFRNKAIEVVEEQVRKWE